LQATLRAPGNALEKPVLPQRLNGTDTKAGKGSGADEKRVRGNRSTTFGDIASHLQAKKIETTLTRRTLRPAGTHNV